MHFSDLFAAMLTVAAAVDARYLQERAACNADNCARLVTGTRAGLPTTRLADCSSFMAVTETPSPVTTTETITIIYPVAQYSVHTVSTVSLTTVISDTTIVSVDRETNTPDPVKRSAPESTIPGYATSDCPVASRYSSACSCAGATAMTTTLATPTTTETETLVTTSTYLYVSNTTVTTVDAITRVTTTDFATETGYPCGATEAGNGIYTFRNYKVTCGQRANKVPNSSSGEPNESECLKQCNSVKYCVFANYQFSTGLCNLFYNPVAESDIVQDPDWDSFTLE